MNCLRETSRSIWRVLIANIAAILCTCMLTVPATPFVPQSSEIELAVRQRVETSKQSGRFHTLTRRETWDLSKTAFIVCDMWDYHHCLNAVRRVAEMAPRLNRVLGVARQQNAVIIHAPSSCMAAYAEHPARQRAQDVPTAPDQPPGIDAWCNSIPSEEQATYPIDQSDGGEDDEPQEHAQWAAKLARMGRNPNAPWARQTELLTIDPERDYVSDQGHEVWNILHARGIDNVVLVGVHTNMCVLGRPFGLRQMVKNGKRTVLMRDMTDSMYNPKMWPYVSHFSGTDLIVEHIEKYVCPTISSESFVGGPAFRFKNDTRPHIAIIMAEDEYQTNQTLPEFAGSQLYRDFRVSYVFASDSDRNDLPGLEVLKTADVALWSIRRRVLKPDQMSLVKDFVKSGKPVIGIRTASHAFVLREDSPPAGYLAWPQWDAHVWGGHYTGHYGNQKTASIRTVAGQADHPILAGIEEKSFTAGGSLYKTSPVSDAATVLLTGEIEGQPAEAVAWTFQNQYGGRAFYTSLGHKADFENPAFRKLLLNSVNWAVGQTKNRSVLNDK